MADLHCPPEGEDGEGRGACDEQVQRAGRSEGALGTPREASSRTIGGPARAVEVESAPLADPAAFGELAARLEGLVKVPYDVIVVRDLFGDRVLGYQLSLLTAKPVVVSYNREGAIGLDVPERVPPGSDVLIVADVHFAPNSLSAAALAAERAGLSVAGGALLPSVLPEEYAFGVAALESRV